MAEESTQEGAATDDGNLLENIKDQIELPNMFKKYTYDDMKGLLETWMETGQVGDNNEESEAQPTQTNNQTTNEPKAAAVSTSNSDVKDAFEDLFNN